MFNKEVAPMVERKLVCGEKDSILPFTDQDLGQVI